ncbi:uncharacterized protein LOC134839904 [Symsagittifera roscoffensis]|uniref:uncharacterized protein LOC134839904 n=1 Tax=Symsagittifera roscoffensis TaxID=84072 RepID=UPI00307CB10B
MKTWREKHPLWNADPVEFASYREELNEQILGCDKHIKLIIGGDWNSSIGDTNRRTQDKVAGAYGLGNTNAAGNDLINWCHEHELAWTNSFFRHKKRGTWKCPARKSWHKIDGFMTRQNQRSRLVKNVRTETTSRTLSDHKPKMMECWLQKPRKEPERRQQRSTNINWDKLRDPATKQQFRTSVGEALSRSEMTWKELIKKVREAGKNICGHVEKTNLNPWMDTHNEEIKSFQMRISQVTRAIETAEGLVERTEKILARKNIRKEYKKEKRRWELDWWLNFVEEVKEAEQRGDTRQMYKTLKKLGCKDLRIFEEKHFSPDEFREHFMKVSENRFEREISEIMETAASTTKRTDEEAANAAKHLEREITFAEFQRELGKIKDGAPGCESVRVSARKNLNDDAKRQLFQGMLHHLDTPIAQWPEETAEGWMIPLYKKGTKMDMGNYRGVCLLPLISRIVACIFASRIREWAEELKVLGENQNGFRTGRSTCGATQIILRIDEETRRVLGNSNDETEDRPGAVLLDITKAYPRVNRPLLWSLLENLDMTKKV